MVAELLAIMGFSTSNPMIPLFLRELGVQDAAGLNWWTGAINGLSSLALAVFAPIWGALADHYGRKLMLLRAMIGGAVIMGLLALANAPWQVLVLKILQGCVTGTVAAATVLTASLVPAAEAGYYLGLMQMSVFIGNSIGPLFGGVITDLAGSRINFLATSVLLALSAFLVIKFVAEDFVPENKTGSLLKNAVPDFSVLRGNTSLKALLALIFTIQFANAVVSPIIPLVVLHMTEAFRGTGSLSGLIIGIASIAGALGALIAGKVSNRIGYGRALLICIAGSFLFYLPQGFAVTPYQLLVLRFFTGFFLGGTMPSANALIAQQTSKDHQGAVFGISSSISAGGNALGPAFGALAANLIGYPAIFFLASLMLGLLAFFMSKRISGGFTMKSLGFRRRM